MADAELEEVSFSELRKKSAKSRRLEERDLHNSSSRGVHAEVVRDRKARMSSESKYLQNRSGLFVTNLQPDKPNVCTISTYLLVNT